jgi:hypothetical protein
MEMPTLPLPTLPHISLAFLFNVPVLVVILILFAIFYSIVSSVIVYHWHAYGMQSQGILVAESLYIIVTAALFVSAGLSLFYF